MWMRHVAWCLWYGMIKLPCQGNDTPTELILKAVCLLPRPSFSFSTAQKIFISAPQSHTLQGQTKVPEQRNSISELWIAQRTFYFGRRPRLHVWQSNRLSRSQKHFFVTIGSTRLTRTNFTFLSFFQNVFTVSFTMVIKWSPGGESGRQLWNPPV